MEGRPVPQHHEKDRTDYRPGVAAVHYHSLRIATLGQLMESVLWKLTSKACLVYLDDVIFVG
jgi:hypothetical protein